MKNMIYTEKKGLTTLGTGGPSLLGLHVKGGPEINASSLSFNAPDHIRYMFFF